MKNCMILLALSLMLLFSCSDDNNNLNGNQNNSEISGSGENGESNSDPEDGENNGEANNGDPEENENGGNNGNDVKKPYIKLVEAKRICVWPGETNSYTIVSEGAVSVTPPDPSIAEAWVEDNTLFVTAIGIGETSLILKDGILNDLEISVSTRLLLGLYVEEYRITEAYYPHLFPKNIVVAEDENVAAIITEELEREAARYHTAKYGFETDGRFIMELAENSHLPIHGTYSWDGETLILNYEGRSDTYSFKNISDSGPRPYMYSLTVDLTDKYKELYPNAGIESVSATRYISAIPPYVASEWWEEGAY